MNTNAQFLNGTRVPLRSQTLFEVETQSDSPGIKVNRDFLPILREALKTYDRHLQRQVAAKDETSEAAAETLKTMVTMRILDDPTRVKTTRIVVPATFTEQVDEEAIVTIDVHHPPDWGLDEIIEAFRSGFPMTFAVVDAQRTPSHECPEATIQTRRYHWIDAEYEEPEDHEH